MKDKYDLKGIPFILVTLALALCTFMEVLDFSIANVSIPHIAGDLGVSNNEGTWVITLYMVGNAIVLPISGWLSEKIGSIRLILLASLLFGVTSWLCGVAFTFPMLCICRFLQGAVAGPLIPLSQVLLVDIFPAGKKHMALALWAMVALIGPISGPLVGGWITEDYSWRWIFYINIPVSIFSTVVIGIYMRKYIGKVVQKILDVWGLIFLIISMTCLQILLDQGRQMDWFSSKTIQILGAVTLVSLSLLIVYEWNCKDPLIDLRLLKIRSFGLGTFILGISFMVFFSPLVITPLWLESIMGYTPLQAGAVLATMGIVPFMCAPLIGKLMGSGQLKLMVFISFIFMACAFFYFTTFDTQISFSKLAWSRFYLGFGLAPYIAPIIALSLSQVPENKLARASSLLQFFRIFMSGVGTSLYTTLWNDRAAFHHSRLVEVLTPFSRGINQIKNLMSHHFKPAIAFANQLVDEQAYMLATNDIMLLSAIFLILLCFILKFINVSAEEIRKKGIHVGE